LKGVGRGVEGNFAEQNDELLQLPLENRPNRVQMKYGKGFASLGRRFAVDSEPSYFVYFTAQGSEEQAADFVPGGGREELYRYMNQL
jgi:hypothetical protein